jgi:rhodanese-related sulfurtransferase/transcriptional regulator with XRE-family HTH domain
MKTISVRELQDLLASGGVDLIDVREPEEWSAGHISGARLVPLAQLRADAAGVLPRDHIVFVCAKGGRSAAAAQLAERIGKQQVYSLDGGTVGWVSAGLQLVVPEPRSGTAAGAAELPAASESALGNEPALDALVTVNLRRFRADQGWSLDDLAREAGVSRALLGQIEIGRAVPSIGIVWKLAQTLGIPFSALLSTDRRAGTAVSKRAAAKRLLSADGRFSSRALFPLGDPQAPEFYELWLAPHSREDAEAHRPGTRENLVVTAGQLELQIGREKHLLGVGDAIVFTADVPHSYVNLGRDECWMYLVMHYPKV